MAGPSTEELAIEHIKCSHAALDIANTELTKHAETEKRAAALIPAAVDALIKHRRIDASEREKAAASLRDPVAVLEILARTADPRVGIDPPAPATMGKAAGAGEPLPARGGYTGERTGEKSAADLAFERALGY